jgi:CDP-diacylglycerol---serine O-phosphatidyltransferase
MSTTTQEMSSKFHPLPCMFTIASLFCGFYSIVAAIKGDFTIAANTILIAAVFDGLDGRVARLTGTTSTFGMELDSLCDLVSFGVAPGLLAYLWALQPFNRYGWLAGFLYVATTALRLARFNCQHTGTSKHFVGLPCPAAAAMISATVLFSHYLGFEGTVNNISLLFLVYILSYLMVSTHLYFSFKQTDSKKSRTFQLLVGTLLLFILVASLPEVMLFLIFSVYISSGPVFALYRRIKKIFKTPAINPNHNPSSPSK